MSREPSRPAGRYRSAQFLGNGGVDAGQSVEAEGTPGGALGLAAPEGQSRQQSTPPPATAVLVSVRLSWESPLQLHG